MLEICPLFFYLLPDVAIFYRSIPLCIIIHHLLHCLFLDKLQALPLAHCFNILSTDAWTCPRFTDTVLCSGFCAVPFTNLFIFSMLLVCLDFFPFWFPCCKQEPPQLYSEMLCIYSIAEILFMILQRWPRNGLGSAAALLVWRASICFYLAYTSPARTCSVWQNTAMWLRVIKSIKALTSCNLIFHFVHIHKCLIELKLNTKKFERPNLYILFSLYRSDVISQRNYKTLLLRKCPIDLFKLCCHILEVLVMSIPSI